MMRWNAHRGWWVKWLIWWAASTLVLSLTLPPVPVLELPIDSKSGSQVGIGFTDDNLSFLTMELAGDDWSTGKLTAWELSTGQPTDRGNSRRAYKPIEWIFDLPLGLDGLCFKKAEKLWQVHENATQKLLYTCQRGDAKPVLARWSPDRRWVALEWKTKDIELIDLSGTQPVTHISQESIIQFTPDSSSLLTERNTDSKNRIYLYGLNSWSLHTGKKRWSNPNARAPSITHFLWMEQYKVSFVDFKLDGKTTSTGATFGSDEDFFPIAFGTTQALVKQQKQEWQSPIAEWLNQHEWYGFGSGRFWNELVVVDLSTGSMVTPGPLRSIHGMEALASSDGKFLAMQVRDKAPWYDRWVIYQLPFQRRYGHAMLYATLLTLVIMGVMRVWRRVYCSIGATNVSRWSMDKT